MEINGHDLKGCFSYCTCKTGQRVCGCAHTVAVLFYLIHELQSMPLPKILPRASLMENGFLDCLEYKIKTELKRKVSPPKKATKRKYQRRKKKPPKHRNVNKNDDELISKPLRSSNPSRRKKQQYVFMFLDKKRFSFRHMLIFKNNS